MVKPDPDDIISALSSNLKRKNEAPVLRLTFKRGGLWQQQFAKAHSHKAKLQIKQKLIAQNTKDEDKEYPLLVRYKENTKEESVRYNASTKPGKGLAFIESLLSVFRVNFFNRKQEVKDKVEKTKSKPNPESKTTARKLIKKQKNKDRKQKLKELQRLKKRQAKKQQKVVQPETK